MPVTPLTRTGRVALTLGLAMSLPAASLGDGGEHRARMMGALSETFLSVRGDDVPAPVALDALSRALAIPIVGRFADERHPDDLDPNVIVSLRMERAPAIEVLEAIVDQCEELEPCTWQFRTGFIEVGTKERLSVPAACELRLYPISVFMIEPVPPEFERRPDGPAFEDRPYATAVLSRPFEPKDPREDRKRKEELAREIVQGIIELVEPGNWDFGQYAEHDQRHDELDPTPPDGRPRKGRPRAAPSWRAAPAGNKIARLRLLRESIMIDAPDYVHRRVMTQHSRPPAPLSDQERADRSALASGDGLTIILLPAPEGAPR